MSKKIRPSSTAPSSSSAAIPNHPSASSPPLPARRRRVVGFSQEEVPTSKSMNWTFAREEASTHNCVSTTDSPFPGVPMITDTTYLDITPNRRIVTCSTMTIGENRVSVALVTFELLPTDKGTDLICTHQGAFFEGSGGPEMREEGWRKIFENLDKELAS